MKSAESGGDIHLEINFSSKVYSKSLLQWKVLCNVKLGHQKLVIPLTSYCAFF